METKNFVTLPGQEPIWNMAPGRTAALKLQNEQTGESVMASEEVTPPAPRQRSTYIATRRIDVCAERRI
jgi:hypothetical protein